MTDAEQSEGAAEQTSVEELESAMRKSLKSRKADLAALNVKMIDNREAGNEPVDKSPMQDPHGDDRLDELLEDQLEVLRQVQTLAVEQTRQSQRLDALAESVRGMATTTHQGLSRLRTELLSESKGVAHLRTLEALVEPYDRLSNMCEALQRQRNAAKPSQRSRRRKSKQDDSAESVHNQLRAVVMILERAIRDLGFERFEVQVGEPFDPEQMQCSPDYAEGEPGIVLKVMKPGYRAGNAVVIPAEVVIADPLAASADSETTKEEKEIGEPR